MSNFESGRNKVPDDCRETNALAQQAIANISAKTMRAAETPVGVSNFSQNAVGNQSLSIKHQGISANGTSTSIMSDDDLVRVLNVKSVKVRELESAVLRAQMSQNG